MRLLGGILAAAIALPGAHAGWIKGTNGWPAAATCALLPDESCGGADGAEDLYIHLLMDVSGSVSQGGDGVLNFQRDCVDFVDDFMKAVYCARYNLPEDKTKLWVATWSSGNAYAVSPDGDGWDTQFALGDAWGNDKADFSPARDLATSLDRLKEVVPDGGTHPGGALKKAADIAEGSSGAKNFVVLFTDGQMGGGRTLAALQKIKDDIQEQITRVKAVPNTLLITVGIGTGVEEDVLKGYATTPGDYLSVADFAALDEVIQGLLSQIACDESGGGALEEPPTNYPTSAPPTFSASPTTIPPTLLNSLSPTRSPIGDDTRSPTSPAAPRAALGRAAPLLVLAACALQLIF